MAAQFAIKVVAAGVAASTLYVAVSQADRLKEVATKTSKETGTEVKITWVDPKKAALLLGEPLVDAVVGTIQLKAKKSKSEVQAALLRAINDVDAKIVKQYLDITLQPASFVGLLNGETGGAGGFNVDAPTVDVFGVQMFNLSKKAMYPQLFKGFETDGATGKHVAWRISDYPIVGPTSSASTKWSIQYAMCYGQLTDDDKYFTVSGYTPCDLDDAGTLVKKDDGSVAIELTGKGDPGTITIAVPAGFPSGFYVGFGQVTGSGDSLACHPTGIVEADDGISTSFTPKNDYSVNFVTTQQDMGVYLSTSSSTFGHFDFTGTSDHFAKCTFKADGTWVCTTSSTPPALKSIEGADGITPHTITLPAGNIKSIHVDYYP